MKCTLYERLVFVRCLQLFCVGLLLIVVMNITGCPTPAPIPTPPAAPTPTPAPTPKVILRLHGSNSVAAQLIPDLAEAFLVMKGAENIHRQTDSDRDTMIIQGHVAESASSQKIEILSQDSGTAFADLAAGACDIGLAARKIEAEDVRNTSFSGDLTAPENEHVLALDGIAILVNAKNPVETLSREQIGRIFSGDIRDWAQVGGKAGPIRVYAPDNSSGTYEAFAQLVLTDSALTANAERVTLESAIAEQVSGDAQSIGLVRLAHIGNAVALAVTSGEFAPMQPDPTNITTETYPFSQRLYLYLPSGSQNQVAREFVDFALSDAGQQIVARHEFVDLRMALGQQSDDSANDQTYRKITQGAEPFLVSIRFPDDGATLDNKALRDIARIADFLDSHAQYAERGIGLLEFWDAPQKNQRYNTELSLQYAHAVEQAFRAHDIAPSVIAGFGEITSSPAGDAAKHRRVEVWSLDPDRNSGLNRLPSGAQVLPLNGSDPGGAADYGKGDRTDWYRVVVRAKYGTFTYRVQQYQKHDSTLVVELFYAPRTYRTLDENTPLETFVLHGKDENSFTIEDAQPGVYYAKISAQKAGDESSYKISNIFVSADGTPLSPKPSPDKPVENVTPPPTPTPDSGTHKPVITILSPAQNSTTTEATVLLTGKVTSKNGILQVMINGQPISLAATDPVRDGDRQVLEFSHRVPALRIGENQIVIAAWDDSGNIGTADIRIIRK